MISKKEKNKRHEAVEYAKASGRLEGIILSEDLLVIMDKYANGLLSQEEFTKEYTTAVKAGL
ncbi:hypothetical protein QV08_06295 [Gallibacterium salpingitidis]|uniref:Antitoxin VbhA domain-containing protein n=1 Tax=Gallibacterium salpingitidis TaxID=505341 RepID=A0A1A7QDE0_9PAST|nr:antitoxin VbhA family protein [Gallibacterium salpingitidis]OBW96324.1 hypothetical protein QS62_00830 [Gallibacterium salpingitidis]OBX07963.1 hypothetical protein QV08_06295 [Gallibacterium salpingitidis]OBX11445.1 hypothetical protein QV09_02400 [Gallibacterium salpingitidis]